MNIFKGKKILITGVGSVGQAILKNILNLKPKLVRVFDNNEKSQIYSLREFGHSSNVKFILGDIREKENLSFAMKDINIVFHTASLKDVITCESNPFEAIKTNLIGTQNVIDSAIINNVDKVLFTSSDKGVNPFSVMGATKFLAERLITNANWITEAQHTILFSVRFGNILGSEGSVLPLFIKQIKKEEWITITDPNMTRFIMTMPEVINFLHSTLEISKGGEIFIQKMPALKILDLAQVLIHYYSNTYKTDEKKINIIGKKPGEKLYEELITHEEAERTYNIGKMLVVVPNIPSKERIKFTQYNKTNKIKYKPYRSDNIKLLTHTEIKNLLISSKLLF